MRGTLIRNILYAIKPAPRRTRESWSSRGSPSTKVRKNHRSRPSRLRLRFRQRSVIEVPEFLRYQASHCFAIVARNEANIVSSYTCVQEIRCDAVPSGGSIPLNGNINTVPIRINVRVEGVEDNAEEVC